MHRVKDRQTNVEQRAGVPQDSAKCTAVKVKFEYSIPLIKEYNKLTTQTKHQNNQKMIQFLAHAFDN